MLDCDNKACSQYDSSSKHNCCTWDRKVLCDFLPKIKVSGGILVQTNPFKEGEEEEEIEVPGGSCPSQYSFPSGLCELQDLIELKNMNFAIGNIFKACYRLGNCEHSDIKRDLNKILFFAKRELDRVTKGESNAEI